MRSKSIVLLAAFLAAASVIVVKGIEPVNAEEISSLKKVAIAECTNFLNITKDAIDDIMNHVAVSKDPKVKCWLSCVMNKTGVMKEGKMDWEFSKFITQAGLADEKDKAQVDKIADFCRAEVPLDVTDECELAYSIVVCKIKYWKELGLPIGCEH